MPPFSKQDQNKGDSKLTNITSDTTNWRINRPGKATMLQILTSAYNSPVHDMMPQVGVEQLAYCDRVWPPHLVTFYIEKTATLMRPSL